MTEENRPLVSVFTLTYNHVKYVREALESIVGQETDFEFEVIVHDDASTDGTQEILRELASADERIRLYIEETNQYNNANLSYLRDIFLPTARGRYVAFCEGDDYWTDPHKLQEQFDYMESHPECSMCAHLSRLVDGVTGERIGSFGYGEDDRLLSVDDLLDEWMIPTASSFVRRNELERYVNEWVFDKPVGDFPRAVFFASIGKIHYSGKEQSCYRYSVPGSWTTVVKNDPQKRLEAAGAWLSMLDSMDRALGGRYHGAFVRRAKEYSRLAWQLGKNPSEICGLAKEAVGTFGIADWAKIVLKRAMLRRGYQLVPVKLGRPFSKRLVRIR